MPRLPTILKPRRRRPTGEFYRLYHGGEFDGVKERVPIFNKEPKLKTEIDKRTWYHTGQEWKYESNSYRLSEPSQRPTKGATYIYQAV